jgi:Domain of unknown function (DUF5063)
MLDLPVNFSDSFPVLAEKYCSWSMAVDRDALYDYRTAIRLLPALYIAAIDLPEYPQSDTGDVPSCSDDEWKSVYNRFRTMPVGLYPVILDYSADSNHPVGYGDLLDDLADIYRDLVGPLRVYEAGHSDTALWYWRWGFRHHWGDHIVSAIHVLHHFRPDDQA